jgi:hypothetical protein
MLSVREVGKVLLAEDVEGLLSLGAPVDEYDHEARLITSALGEMGSVNESAIASIVQRVWVDSFGPFSDEDLLRRLPVLRKLARRLRDLFEDRTIA